MIISLFFSRYCLTEMDLSLANVVNAPLNIVFDNYGMYNTILVLYQPLFFLIIA